MSLLQPNKFTNLDNCLLSFSSEMIQVLLKYRYIKYMDLYNIMKDKFSESVDYYFILSLDLFFLLGKIKYEKDNDILRLVR